jgi:hypothetical protein
MKNLVLEKTIIAEALARIVTIAKTKSLGLR